MVATVAVFRLTADGVLCRCQMSCRVGQWRRRLVPILHLPAAVVRASDLLRNHTERFVVVGGVILLLVCVSRNRVVILDIVRRVPPAEHGGICRPAKMLPRFVAAQRYRIPMASALWVRPVVVEVFILVVNRRFAFAPESVPTVQLVPELPSVQISMTLFPDQCMC